MDETMIDNILSDNHGWALEHIATAKDDIEEVTSLLKHR
jgi:4-hydroxyphenylpyruvate dioxygenase-like putative hemolysin